MTTPSTGSILVVSGAPAASELRGVLESAGTAFQLVAVGGVSSALERLGNERFDAVLLDAELIETPAADTINRISRVIDGAALIVRGGDPDLFRSGDFGLDEWISPDEPPAGVAGCVRGAIERGRLRNELRRQRAELAESEARFSSIVEHTPDGIVIVGDDHRVHYVNPGAERIFGRSAAELIDTDFGLPLLWGETTEMDIVRNGGGDPLVAELRVSDTTWNGAPAQVISLRDVTDRKQADERSRLLAREHADREQAEKEAQRFHFLADTGAKLDASLNPDTTLANLAKLIVPRLADWCVIDLIEGDHVRRVAGVHADPARQATLEELMRRYPPHPRSAQPAARVLRSGEAELHRELTPERMHELAVDDEHISLLTQLGTRSSMTVPLDGRDGRLGAMTFVCGERQFDENDLAFACEIATRAALALENARLYDAALLANRAKSDFLAVMSHELRTPLNAILGYTDLLLAGVSGTVAGEQRGYLKRVEAGASHLLRIIDEILTYSQSEAGRIEARPASAPLSEVIRELVEVAKPMIQEKGLEFQVSFPEPDAALFTDAVKLKQIILDLLTNAVKFTEAGSVALSATVDDDQVVISVSDTGIGIAPECLEIIFEPFLQVEQGPTRRVGGTGLGLSVSRELARLLGGELSVESKLGAGSSFTVRLPRRIGA